MAMKSSKAVIFETAFSTYSAVEVIGEGGAGRVYEASDQQGNKWAIKLLDPAKATREKRKRFQNEIAFCSRNKNPNIITVTEYGIIDINGNSAPFYVMPLCSGSLRTLLAPGISSEKALPYFGQILNGVEAAHLQGVVHRDLKPENVLYDEASDRLLISDFGTAQFSEEELYTLVETAPGTRLANFQYAAPEQRARGRSVDQRADIYALGLMLNEMFTGEVPHGTGYRTISSIDERFIYLDDLVALMQRQSPEERPASIEEVKRQLIGRQNQFITSQRISDLKGTVVPVTDIDDPLVIDPLRLVGFDWNDGKLALKLSRPVNDKWVWALQNMGSYDSLAGKSPAHFAVRADTATIGATEQEVQRIIDYFKRWLPKANKVYEQRIRSELIAAENKRRQQLKKEIEEQERRKRILSNTRL